jgi:serine/threonine protein kinase
MDTHQLALPEGFKLANYELTKVLGKGSFGITYLGIDRKLGKKVAIKELIPDSIVTRIEGGMVAVQSDSRESDWEWAKERFLEEASALAGFKHPNIVEVHQLLEANGTVYMVMDYLEGESYEARLQRIGCEPNETSVRRVLEPLLDGLEEVHAAGLLHRDIKPANILLRPGIQPILLDFGSARKLLEEKSVMTSLVTHGYSPIEQYQINGKQGPWTDIYALGTVCVRAITGEKPPMAMDRISEDDFAWLSSSPREGYTPRFLRAIDWAVRVKPKDRPNNIGEWRESFGWPPRKRRVEKQAPAENPVFPSLAPSPKAAQPAPVAAPTPKARSRGWKPLAATLLMVAAAGGAILWLVVGGQPPARPNPSAAKTGNAATPPATVKPKPPSLPLFENSLGMKFAPVPATKLLFSIWDARVRDYRAFVQETGRSWTEPNFTQGPDHPSVNVSWEDAQAFCQWLSAKEKRKYRLPTDEEWSLAAGLPPESGSSPKEKDGQIKNVYPWGTTWPPPPGVGNYGRAKTTDGSGKTSPVGTFEPNRYGLYDMGGNVWQWCDDWYDENHRKRVLRGGAWNILSADILLSSFRYYAPPGDRSDNTGFRCVTPAQ